MVHAVWQNGTSANKQEGYTRSPSLTRSPRPTRRPSLIPRSSLLRLRSRVQFPDLCPVLIRIQLRFPSQNRSLRLERLRSQVTCRVSPRSLPVTMLSPKFPLPAIRRFLRLMPLAPLDWRLSLRPLLTACANVAEATTSV